MPERNLVSVQNVLILTALIASVGLTGCSKLGNTGFEYDRLVDGTNELGWDIGVNNSEKLSEIQDRAKELESAASYMAESEATEENDVARIVAVASEATGIEPKPIKLVASPMRISASPAKAAAPEDCGHQAQCDCHKKREPLKLAHVEPFDMPAPNGSDSVQKKPTAQDFEQVNSAPPKGVISQPLSPLTPIATTVTANSKTTSQIVDEDDEDDNLLRNFSPSDSKETTSSTSRVNRRQQKDLRPQVDSDPVVIVATVSQEDVPPFAEAPSTENFAITNAEAFSEVTTTAADNIEAIEKIKMAVGAPNESNVSDELWDECLRLVSTLFVQDARRLAAPHRNAVRLVLRPVAIQKTATTRVGKNLAVNIVVGSETIPTNGGNFQPLGVAATSFQADNRSSKVAVQVIEDVTDSSNQFAPASFTTELPASEYDMIKQNLDDLELPLPANSFVPAETTPIEVAEADLSKADVDLARKPQTTIPGAATDVELAIPSIEAEPQVQDQPEVKVIHQIEVIDNTIPWDVQLEETIEKVKTDMNGESDPNIRNGLEVNLRLLQVLQRQMQAVEEHRQVLSDQEKSYWQHQLDAINLMLDSRSSDQSDFARHNAALETLAHLRKAVEGLESIANLQLANATFCRQVTGFGQFTPFDSATFKSDQKMLVYCEVENFQSQERSVGSESRFQTSLRGSYAIYDQQGRVVQQAEYPLVEDVVRKRRRDFYMYFPVQLKQLPVGIYRMELLVEDIGGNKTATMPAMDFQVR